MPMSDVLAKFELVKQRVEAIAPESVTNLNAGASPDELALLKQVVPIAPQLLFDLLALHDGEEMIAWTSMFPDGMQLMAIDYIVEKSRSYQSVKPIFISNLDEFASKSAMDRPRGAVKPVFSSALRVPFAHVNGELIWYLDMDPAEGGQMAQIVYEDAEDFTLRVVATSFEDLLDKYLRDLDAGAFFADESSGQIRSHSECWYADPDAAT